MKTMIKPMVRIIISLTLLIVIVNSTELSSVNEVLRSIKPEYLLLAFTMQLMGATLASYRWCLIMSHLKLYVSPLFCLKSYFKGTFFNQILPSGSGDVYRVFDVSTLGHSKKVVFYGVFLERLFGLIGLLLLNLLANMASPDLLPAQVFYILNVLAACGISAVFMFAILGKVERLAHFKFTRHLHELSAVLRSLYHDKYAIILHSVITLLVHFFSMLAMYYIGISVGLNYSLLTLLVLVPPVMLLTVAPISLAGWGVRESGIVGLFLLIGANKAPVLSMSVLYGLTLLLVSLPGLYFFLKSRSVND